MIPCPYAITPRPGSCDAIVFAEVWGEDVYRMRQMDQTWGLVRGLPALDIGANVGAWSLLALHLGASRVHAVEPWPDNAEQLRANLAATSNREHVIVYDAACVGTRDLDRLSIIDGDARFPNISFQTTTKADDRERLEVRTVHIDDLLASEPAWGVLKIDVEGAEFDIFHGVDLDLLDRVACIVAEFHGPGMGQHCAWIEPGSLGMLTEKLSEWGHVETMGAASRGGQLYARRY